MISKGASLVALAIGAATILIFATPGLAQQRRVPPKAWSAPAPRTAAPANNAIPPGNLAGQGAGTIAFGGWRLTNFGCYRGGARLLCDFDLAAVNGTSGQTDVGPFGGLALVDNGGKMSRRHDAYFLATDGSRMARAFYSATPVRYVMEFDDPGPQTGAVSLAHGNAVIKSVPVTPFSGKIDLGSFLAAGWRLSLYGCYRSGTRVVCDFDLATVNGWTGQTNAGPFNGLSLIDNGGKITPRSDAFFMATDGSRMDSAFASATPIRYIVLFDNIAAEIATIGLAEGGYQLPNITVITPDANGIPGRSPMVWPERSNAASAGLASLFPKAGGNAPAPAGQAGQPVAPAPNGALNDNVNKVSGAASQAAQGAQNILDMFKKKK
jgi:hypothetical protein